MKRMNLPALKLSAALIAPIAAATPANAAQLIGLQQGNNTTLAGVYSIDTNTGIQTLIGNSGFAALQDLARSPDGVYYAIAGSSSNSKLITIDPLTGVGSLVAPLTTSAPGGLSIMTGLAVAANGTLYGSGLPTGGSIVNNLYTINRTTGVATLIGSTNASALSALDFNDATGVLYGVNQAGDPVTRGLRTIDVATGNSTFVDSVGVGAGSALGMQDIVFTPDGTLWGSTQQGGLYTIDENGFTLQFSGLAGFRGLESVAPVPIPPAAWLFGSGLTAMVGYARRRADRAATAG